jgi:CRP-like cAMP-binding protein
LLLYLARRFGRAAEDGHLVIDPALTREQIAQFVNARSETVIRIMSRWAKAGWIHGTAPSVHLLRLDMLKRITREG